MTGTLTIDWAPLIPSAALAVLALAALPVVGFALWRRARGAWWRALTAAALLLALANPSLVEEQRDPLDDIALVVVDESPSQNIAPRGEQTEAAVEHVVRQLGALPNTEVRVVRAGADALALDKDGTRLFAALREAMAKVPRQRISGVVVISDGQVHDVPENVETLGLDAPLHLLLTGAEDEGDRRLTIAQAPSFGIVGKPLSLTLKVEDLPAGTGPRLARVTVRRDGAPDQILQIPVGVEQTVDFTLDHRGPNVFDIELGLEKPLRLRAQLAYQERMSGRTRVGLRFVERSEAQTHALLIGVFADPRTWDEAHARQLRSYLGAVLSFGIAMAGFFRSLRRTRRLHPRRLGFSRVRARMAGAERRGWLRDRSPR